DGLRAAFPRYNYDDMVDAQYRLVTEHLGVKHLRAIVGNSMGGMHTWIWGIKHPDAMDALVPMACQPTEMSSRNWMLRRLIIDSIRNDPSGTTATTRSSRAVRSSRRCSSASPPAAARWQPTRQRPRARRPTRSSMRG